MDYGREISGVEADMIRHPTKLAAFFRLILADDQRAWWTEEQARREREGGGTMTGLQARVPSRA